MPPATPAFDEMEPYEVITSDNRRFIVRASDKQTATRNAIYPGENIKVAAVLPVVMRDDLLTAEQLSEKLGGKPTRETLLDWARRRMIPCKRIGSRFLRFVEEDVRLAMSAKEARA